MLYVVSIEPSLLAVGYQYQLGSPQNARSGHRDAFKKALIHIRTFWGCTKLTKEPATQRKVSLGRVGTVGKVPI